MTDPPDIAGLLRPYQYTGQCPVTQHVEKILAEAMADGACPVMCPTERDVHDKLLVQGVTAEDVMSLTGQDLKSAIRAWMRFKRQKGPSRGVMWSLAWLRHEAIGKQQAAWEKGKARERREVADMPTKTAALADAICKPTPMIAAKAWWWALLPADKQAVMADLRDRFGGLSYDALKDKALEERMEADGQEV